jgi:pimeloyl-ACP methyl ester carboxylesterase
MKVTPIILLLFYLTLTLCQRNGAEFPEMVDFYGYPSETHEVTTSDGYILTIFRIPSGREDQSGDGNSQPVLVMHGIPASSDSMIVNGADGSFSFVLADNSYDVWLINLRGNYYSRNHETLDPENDEEFWDYNLLDNVQDAMATVEYILAETGFEQLIMVGVSHGSTVTLISLATEPEWFAERVSLFVGHVPISRLGGMTNPYFNLLTDDTTIELFGFLGLTEILSLNYLQSVAMDVVCIPLPGL